MCLCASFTSNTPSPAQSFVFTDNTFKIFTYRGLKRQVLSMRAGRSPVRTAPVSGQWFRRSCWPPPPHDGHWSVVTQRIMAWLRPLVYKMLDTSGTHLPSLYHIETHSKSCSNSLLIGIGNLFLQDLVSYIYTSHMLHIKNIYLHLEHRNRWTINYFPCT